MNKQKEIEKDIIEEKCKCGCGDRIVTCEICGFKVGYRHRNNHACIIKEKPNETKR